MQTLAMILAGGSGSRLSVLTQKRTKPAVPFGGKYRIIDFTLSNCVNSGIFSVGICTQYRPRSLNDHIGSGRPWDLDRNQGGVSLLQPYMSRRGADWYQGTADAIYQNLDFVRRSRADVVLVLAGDHIYEMDYDVLVSFHLDRGADLTVATLRVPSHEANRFGILETDGDYQVVGFEEKPADPRGTLASMGIYAFNAGVLADVLCDDHDRGQSSHDFGHDIIPRMVTQGHTVHAFPFRGYWVDVGTIQAYWQAHIDLLDDEPALNLLDRGWVIHTLSEERPPVKIRAGASVSQSLITDGCVIEGTVERSVLSPGVMVRPGAVVRDSVLLTDTIVEPGAVVEEAILDKRVHVAEGGHIAGCSAAIGSSGTGLVVIGKNTRLRPGALVGPGSIISADLEEKDFPSLEIAAGTQLGLPDLQGGHR